MEYDCDHWPIWYDFVDEDMDEFVDPLTCGIVEVHPEFRP